MEVDPSMFLDYECYTFIIDDPNVLLYAEHVRDYMGNMEMLQNESIPYEDRVDLHALKTHQYQLLVEEFLELYPGFSTDPNDYYRNSDMARPPPYVPVLDDELPRTPLRLMRTDSMSDYGSYVWYNRTKFHPDSSYSSHSIIHP